MTLAVKMALNCKSYKQTTKQTNKQTKIFIHIASYSLINPLPHIPIFGYSTSAANKDMMSKILTNWDTIF